MLKALIFDLDGTLANTLPIIFESFRRVCREPLGRDLSDAEVFAGFGPIERRMLHEHLGPQRAEALWPAFLAEYEALHEHDCAPFDGVPEAIEDATAAGLRVALVTGKGPDTAEISLRRLGLAGRFEHVVAGDMESRGKTRLLRRMLELLALEPGQAAYLGDSPKDVHDAREVGLRHALAAAWAPTADRPALAATAPDALFDHPLAMRTWLRGLAQPTYTTPQVQHPAGCQ